MSGNICPSEFFWRPEGLEYYLLLLLYDALPRRDGGADSGMGATRLEKCRVRLIIRCCYGSNGALFVPSTGAAPQRTNPFGTERRRGVLIKLYVCKGKKKEVTYIS